MAKSISRILFDRSDKVILLMRRLSAGGAAVGTLAPAAPALICNVRAGRIVAPNARPFAWVLKA
jgi:hypothetical protein